MRNLGAVRILLFALFMLGAVASASAQVGFAITFGPPALPVYEQPLCPGDNYIWAPGYWAFDYDYDDYFWVPGTWVLAPQPGLYWTPGYWAWTGNRFFFHEGYWAREVGFYGGIDYGFGYFGNGYAGGRWDHDRFFYNRAVTNVNVTAVRNVYNTTVINNRVNRVSYNGGNGGITARPTRQQEAVERQRHIAPVAAQLQGVQAARENRDLRATVNRGKPPIAATLEPGRFQGREVVGAREAGGPYHPPANRSAMQQGDNARNQRSESNHQRGNAVHPRDLPPFRREATPNTGNTRRDETIKREQEKLQAKQQQDRQKLERNQEREDQKLQHKRADEARMQQMEQRHQEQTHQMEQKQAEQRQRMEQRRPPERRSEARPPKQERPN